MNKGSDQIKKEKYIANRGTAQKPINPVGAPRVQSLSGPEKSEASRLTGTPGLD